MKLTQSLSVLSLLAVTACGSSVGHVHDDVAKDDVAQGAEGVLAQYRLIVGDFEARSSTAECIALRTKISGHRDQVRVGSEWRTIKETAPFKALDAAERRFRDGGCTAGDQHPSEACETLAKQLDDQAKALGETPQWQTLDNNNYWHDLLGDVRKAQQIECL